VRLRATSISTEPSLFSADCSQRVCEDWITADFSSYAPAMLSPLLSYLYDSQKKKGKGKPTLGAHQSQHMERFSPVDDGTSTRFWGTY